MNHFPTYVVFITLAYLPNDLVLNVVSFLDLR